MNAKRPDDGALPLALAMQEYVVECYLSKARIGELSTDVARARAAARAMTLEGTPVRYLRSIVIPEDETCFHVFEGRSAEAVGEASRRAALEYERIVEALQCDRLATFHATEFVSLKPQQHEGLK